MGLFPGYTEVSCPCCDCYRHVVANELDELRKKQRCKGNKILCDECWRVFLKVMKRFRKKEETK